LEHTQIAGSVARFIERRLTESSCERSQIAARCGFRDLKVLTMIATGVAKLPIKKIGVLAEALGADPAHLLRLVLAEYLPDVWEAIEAHLPSTVLTTNELELVKAYRQITGDSDASPAAIDRNAAVSAIVVA